MKRNRRSTRTGTTTLALLTRVVSVRQLAVAAALLIAPALSGAMVHVKPFVTEHDLDEFQRLCKESLELRGIVCVRGRDSEDARQRPSPWQDIQSTKEFAQAYARHGKQAVQFKGTGLPVFSVYYRQKIDGQWVTRVYLFSGVQLQIEELNSWLAMKLEELKVWPEGSGQASAILFAPTRARLAEEEKQRPIAQVARANDEAQQRRVSQSREAELAAEQNKTKPACTDVNVTGIIASSVEEVEALHSPGLKPADLEDVLARHPYSCQINRFGVAFGCRGGSYLNGRRATVKEWTPTHFSIEVPLDFHIGRRDVPAIVRRTDVKCRPT